jgi:hypothetical protein
LLVLVLFGGVACSDHSSGIASGLSDPQGPSNPASPTNPVSPGTLSDAGEATHPGVGQPDPGNPDPGPPAEPIPEPATMFLLGTGLASAAVYHRRRRRKNSQLSDNQTTAVG